MASYQRCIRLARPEKNQITTCGTVTQCLWQLSSLCKNILTSISIKLLSNHFLSFVVSRILALSLIASVFPVQTILSCLLHALIMTVWLFFFDTSPFCKDNQVLSFLFSFVLGVVFVFNYFLPKEGNTRYRYAFYYTLVGLENFVCVGISIFFIDGNFYIAFLIISIIVIVSFIIGIILMVSYYSCCHPTSNNTAN